MEYHIDFNSLEEYKIELDKNIEILNEELSKIYKAHSEVTWNGVAYEVATEKLYNKLSLMSNMIRVLSLMSKFMETAHNNYREGLEEIQKNFEEVLEKIRAEKAKRGEIWDNI